MQIERIRFDRVFDIQSQRGNFSFASGEVVVYGAKLPGRAIPSEGASWDVAFENSGDWSTLLGWRNLETQQLTVNHDMQSLLIGQFELLFYLGIPMAVLAVVIGGPALALSLLLTGSLAGAWMINRIVRRNRRVRAALLHA